MSSLRGVLFVENQDSFTWNVAETLPVPRARIRMLSAARLRARPELMARAGVVVIGPGPRDPVRAGLIGLIRRAARLRKPLLGVCLGHQALGLAFGAHLTRTEPTHGKRSWLNFEKSRLFPGVRGRFLAMRYHSLTLSGVRAPLRVVAETAGGLPMAVEHESLPMAGVQFHPDSYATPRGRELVAAFFKAAS